MKAINIISFVLIGLQIPVAIAQDQSSAQLKGDGSPVPGVTASKVTQEQSPLTQTAPVKYVDRDTLAHFADEHLKNCDAFIEIKQYERAMKECNLAIGFIEYDQSQRNSLSYYASKAYLKRGDFYMRRREYKSAIDDYYVASTCTGSSSLKSQPSIDTRLGEAYFFAGNYTKAADEFMLALSGGRHEPYSINYNFEDSFTHFDKNAHQAEVLFRTGRVVDAAKLFHNIVISYGKYLQTNCSDFDKEFLDYIQLRNAQYCAPKPHTAKDPVSASPKSNVFHGYYFQGYYVKQVLVSPMLDSVVYTPVREGELLRKPGWSRGQKEFHGDIEFKATLNDRVYCVLPGYVTRVGWRDANRGVCVEVYHPYPNARTIYEHLNAYSVLPGQWVQRGRVIGYAGETGQVTTACLGFTVINQKTNQYIDPMAFLNMAPEYVIALQHTRAKSIASKPKPAPKPINVVHEPWFISYPAAIINATKSISRNITLILVLVGALGFIALCFYLWSFFKNKFDKKFGKDSFTNFSLGLFWILLGIFFVVFSLVYSHESFSSSHQSGKCIKTTTNIFNQVVQKEEFALKDITKLSIETYSSHSGLSTTTTSKLEAVVNGTQVEIPTDKSKPLKEQKQAFEQFLKNANASDYSQAVSFIEYIWFGIGFLSLGSCYLIGTFVKLGKLKEIQGAYIL